MASHHHYIIFHHQNDLLTLSSTSSCGAFLKTWLPFLMLTGIILTVALALNLRWPGGPAEDTQEPPRVWCGVDLPGSKGAHHTVSCKRSKGVKRLFSSARGLLNRNVQRSKMWWVCGEQAARFCLWWSWNSYWVISLERSDYTPTQTHLMDYDYWKPNSRSHRHLQCVDVA